MDEEVVEEAPAETEEVTEQVSEEAPAAEETDWRDAITDADLRKHAERFADPIDAVKQHFEQRKVLSNTIPVPRKNAKQEDMDAFHKQLRDVGYGPPERIDDYQVVLPEGMEETVLEDEGVKERLKSFAEVAFNSKMPGKDFTAAVNWYLGETMRVESELAKQHDAFAEEGHAALREKWGAQMDKEMAYATRGAEWAFAENLDNFRSMKDESGKFIADHPFIVEAMNKAGRAVSEDSIGTFPVDAETAQSHRAELEKLTSEQYTASLRGEHQKAQAIDLKIMELSRKISGDDPLIGDGRAA